MNYTFTIKAKITNPNAIYGYLYWEVLSYSGTTLDSGNVAIASNGSTTITASWVGTQNGNYVILNCWFELPSESSKYETTSSTTSKTLLFSGISSEV